MPLFPYSYEISNGCKPKTTNATMETYVQSMYKGCFRVSGPLARMKCIV